jgi:hypothetical protein
MGDRCGPCFDRSLEGLPPLGPSILRHGLGVWDQMALAPSGQLVTLRRTAGEEDMAWLVLSVWLPPYDAPYWQHELPGPGIVSAPACDGRRIAVIAQGRLSLFSVDGPGTHSSVPFKESIGSGWPPALAGRDGEWVVYFGAGHLRGWPIRPDGTIGEMAYDLGVPDTCGLSVWAGSPWVVLSRQDVVSLHDAATGVEVERFAVRASVNRQSVIASPDGCLAAVQAGDQPSLASWKRQAAEKPRGWMSWLVGVGSYQPVLRRATAVQYRQLALSPDGNTLIGSGYSGEGYALDCLDPVTFEVRSSLRPWLQPLYLLGLTTHGQLLVRTTQGLAVYPWRELLGVGR